MPHGRCGCRARRAVHFVGILVGLAVLQSGSFTWAQTAPAPSTRVPGESRFSRGAEAEIIFQEGKLQYQSKQLTEAEAKFRQVIQADPADSEAYYFLGLAQLDQGKTAESIQSLNQSVRLDPTVLEVRAARATANLRAGFLDAAKEDVDLLAPNPQWASLVHYLRGRILYNQGKMEEARAEFADARTAGGTEAEPAGLYTGLTYMYLRDNVRARAAFRETNIDPIRDPTVAAAARQLDAALASQEGVATRPWTASLTISYVYDSNVVQLGNNTNLPTGISNKEDGRIVVQPAGSYTLIHTDKLDAGIAASGYFAFQFDLNTFDVASYAIGPFVRYRLAQNLYAEGQYSFNYIQLEHDTYLNRNILTGALTLQEPKFGSTQAYYQFEARQFADEFDHLDPTTTNFNARNTLDRDGQLHTFGLVQDIILPEFFRDAGNANLEFIYRISDQETHGSDYAGLFQQVGITLSTPLPFWNLRADAGVSYEWDNYRNANSLDTGGDQRFDTIINATVGVTKEVSKQLSVRVDYTFTNDDSNVKFGDQDIFDYDRHQVGVRLIYVF